LRQTDTEQYAGMGSDSIHFDPDAVFMKKSVTILPEKGDSTVSFLNQTFNGKNVVEFQALLIEIVCFELSGNIFQAFIIKVVNSRWLIFANLDAKIHFTSAFIAKDRGVHVGKKISLIGVELFYKGDIFVKFLLAEGLFCPSEKTEPEEGCML
jgi:hypothetical protein